MKIFQTIRMNLDAIGYRANDNTLNKNHVWALLISSSVIAAQIEYIFHEANGIEEYTLCFFMTITGIGIFISFLSTILRKNELNDLFDNVQAIIDEVSENPVSKVKCDQTNELVEKLSEVIDILMAKVSVPLFEWPKAIFCLVVYFTTDLGPDAFKLPIPHWFPFNWRKPTGYSMAIAIQTFMLTYPMRYLACFVTLALGNFMMTITLTNDVIDDINLFTEDLKSKIDISKKLFKVISLHSNAKESTDGFAKLYATTITVLFAASIIAMAIAMLMIQVQIVSIIFFLFIGIKIRNKAASIEALKARVANESRGNINSVILLQSFICGFWAFVLVFFANEIGQRYSDIFKRIEDQICQLKWYLYPMKLQRFVPIVIGNVQQPIAIQFFGSAVCSREQFKKAVKTGYSYFMVLHKID